MFAKSYFYLPWFISLHLWLILCQNVQSKCKPRNINEKEFNRTWFKLFGTEILRSSVGPTPLGLFAPNFPLHLLLFLGLFCWLTGCFHWGVLVNLTIKNYVSDFFPNSDFWYIIKNNVFSKNTMCLNSQWTGNVNIE